MPHRPRDLHYHDDDGESGRGPARTAFTDFDCPSCSANNPTGEPFGDGDEILCNYCGTEYRVKITEEGRLQLKEM
jgi:hypothetical protein